MRVLLVEDDPIIFESIKGFLTKKGFAVDLATSLSEARQKAFNEAHDVVIVDRMLPDGDGVELLVSLRAEKNSTPVLMLTAMNLNRDVIEGLNAGADDYLPKPFDLLVLLARLKSLLRRRQKETIDPVLRISNLEINTSNNEVKRGGKNIYLSPKEYSLLEYLAIHKNKAIDRMTLLEHVWDENTDLFSNTVDVHIRYLRIKVDALFADKLIKTVKGKGYMLCGD